MMKRQIQTSEAPAAIGPYSQAVQAGNFIFYSGQIPLNPQTGDLVEGGIAAQARQVMANIGAMLKASGRSFDDIVKTTIYLTDLADFGAVNQIYGDFFGDVPPARACVQVSALPKGADIEIEWIATA